MGRMTPIRAVSLDCTGTLFTWSASIGSLYHLGLSRAACKHKIDHKLPTSQELDAVFGAAFRDVQHRWPLFGYAHSVSSYNWWREVAGIAVAAAGAKGMTEDTQAWDLAFKEVYGIFQGPEAYKLFPDTLPFLHWAHARGLRIGVISNSTESYRDKILPLLGLDEFVEAAVYSKVDGYEKPDSRCFDLLLTKLAAVRPTATGIRPLSMDEVLHIGDTYETDAVGANKAGARSFLLNRGGKTTIPLPPQESAMNAPLPTGKSLHDVQKYIEQFT